MQKVSRFIALLLLICNTIAYAQTDTRQPRILLLLDGSSSMSYEWQSGTKRFDAASKLILKLIDSVYAVNKDVEFALRVYGHQYPAQANNCRDTKLEVMFSKDNLTQMSLRLASLQAIGVSPIAYSLKEAAENDVTDLLRNTYSLILITDGAESCGGDICAIVKELLNKKIEFKPYILSLVDNPSLKTGYDCLGNYLTVTKEEDVPAVVGKIVENYKQMLLMQKIDKKTLETALVNAPSVQKINIPKFEIKKEVETQEPIQQLGTKPTVITSGNINTTTPKPVAVPQAVRKEPEPVLLKDNYPAMNFIGSSKTLPTYSATPVPPTVSLPPYKRPAIIDEPVPPKVANVPPPKPKENTEPPKIIKPLDIKPPVVDAPTGESSLQVYISDGKNFFETAPQLVIVDRATKKEVKKFFRTVDVRGKPQPQKINAGNYLLSIAGKEAKYGYVEVELKPGENKAITIPINNGSILFYYENSKKQIKGYEAKVSLRFSNQPPVIQKIEQELQYEPGMYHVEVNTLPPYKKTFYLEMGFQRGQGIPVEGTLVVKNDKLIGKVILYEPDGDRFKPFYTFNITGKGDDVQLPILPGTYKAGYKKNPGLPLEEETFVNFVITSENVTNLELNK